MMIFLKALGISRSTPIKTAYKPTLRITIIWTTSTSISLKTCTVARMVLLAMSMDQHARLNNVYSHTPEGDPIQSPFVHNFNHQQLRHMQHQQQFGNSLQSPSFAGSPLTGSDLHNGSVDNSYMNAKARPRPSLTRCSGRAPNTRSPLTPKTPGLGVQSLNLNAQSRGASQRNQSGLTLSDTRRLPQGHGILRVLVA